MPFPTGKSFASKHNKKLKGTAANKAARMATGMINKGMPEGQAIRIANAAGDKAMGMGPRASSKSKLPPKQSKNTFQTDPMDYFQGKPKAAKAPTGKKSRRF